MAGEGALLEVGALLEGALLEVPFLEVASEPGVALLAEAWAGVGTVRGQAVGEHLLAVKIPYLEETNRGTKR